MIVRVAAVQTDPQLRDKEHNLAVIEKFTRDVAARGAKLAVFPECAVNGYRYENLAEVAEDAETVPGPATDRLAALARETGCYLAVGIVERDGAQFYNCAALIGPDGLVGKYRKTHLPFQAVDRFVSPGDLPFPIYDTPFARIGLLICYDMRFPEPARVLTLAGAQVIANLTALPEPGWPQPDFMLQTRAAENRVFVVCADRVGTETGCRFIGRSAVISTEGVKLADADDSSETAIVATIDPAEADRKDLVFQPGVYEMHLLADRRSDLYGPLTAEAPEFAGGPQ